MPKAYPSEFRDDVVAVAQRREDGVRLQLRQMVKALPKNATAIQVQIVGVSVSLDSLSANLNLAQTRAEKLAEFFKDNGVRGKFTVTVSTTFTVDGAERASNSLRSGSADMKPVVGGDGKPLSTATILYQVPDIPAT